MESEQTLLTLYQDFYDDCIHYTSYIPSPNRIKIHYTLCKYFLNPYTRLFQAFADDLIAYAFITKYILSKVDQCDLPAIFQFFIALYHPNQHNLSYAPSVRGLLDFPH